MSWRPPESDEWVPPDEDESIGQEKITSEEPASSTPYQDIWSQPDKGVLSKAWESLAVPEKTARKILNPIAEAVPEGEITGNLPEDLARGTPRILANTVAEALPGFVSRASILTAGGASALRALRPVGSVVGKGIAGQLESATGSNPGSLQRAWNDPKLMFGKGTKAASPLYNAGKAEMEGANIFKGMFDAREIVDKGKKYLDMGGRLEPAEALMYRKAIDSVGRGRSVIKDALVEMRGVADKAVKASENMSAADKVFQRGLDSESLRKILPQNKYGGTSAFKTAIMSVLGPSFAGILSPAVHGAAATFGGMAARVATNPLAAMTARQALITAFVENRSQGSR